MTEKKYTPDDLEDMIYELGVELSDPMGGLVVKTLQRNFFEEYKEFSLMDAFECMLDEVNRVNKIIELHDVLVDLDRTDLESLLGGKGDVE